MTAVEPVEKPIETTITEQPQKEEAMGTVKRKLGKCDQCGSEKNTAMHCGKNVCSGCMSMRIAAKNNPSAVIAALEEFGHFHLPAEPKEDDTVDLAENTALRSDNEILKRKVADMSDSARLDAERIADYSKQLHVYERLLDEIAIALSFTGSAEIHIQTEVSILKQEKDRLQELLDDAIAELDAMTLAAKTPQPSDPSRAGVLLDIAMDAMAGKITGLDVGRLQALR